MPDPTPNISPEILHPPVYACEPVIAAIEFLHKEIKNFQDEGIVPAEGNNRMYDSPNDIARLCGKLCAEGCVRNLHFEAESIGIALPDSEEREQLFTYVSDTLMFGFMMDEDDKQQETAVQTIELPSPDGVVFKEIITRRLDSLRSPELLNDITVLHNRDNPDFQMTPEEMQALFDRHITPVKDEETWDKMAEFCKGNTRLALGIMAYFQETFPLFRSSDPTDVQNAELISQAYISRDGSYMKKFNGFKPGNPYEITAVDFHNLAKLIDSHGWLNLPMPYGHRCMFVTENPDEYASWVIGTDGAIELLDGNPNTLPPSQTMRAIEARSHDSTNE